MALREELERQGNWLFRWRSYVPLAAAGPVVWTLLRHAPNGHMGLDDPWVALCFGIAIVGLAARALVIGHVPADTSGRNTRDGQVAATLNTTGMYSLCRHPLYLGNLLMWIGVAMLSRSWTAVLITALAFWLYYERIMFAEEEYLRRRFGRAYEDWSEHTPAFIPNPRRWARPTLSFSMRNVLRREYSGLLAIVLSFTLLDTIANSRAAGQLEVDRVDIVLLTAAFTIYLSLRTLKRRTRLLHVEGR